MRYSIIISHEQAEYACRFDSILGDSRLVFVFDAFSGADEEAMRNIPGAASVIMESAGNRSANRNAGLSYVERKFHPADDDVIEFFDGDRVPVTYCPPDMGDADVLLYTCEHDKRLQKLHPGKVTTETLCNPFYSCGFAMRYRAIRKIEELNGGRLFNETFRGWGCEDQYLGLQCAKLGLSVYLDGNVRLEGKVGGDEFLHANYGEILQQYVDITRANGLFPHKNRLIQA